MNAFTRSVEAELPARYQAFLDRFDTAIDSRNGLANSLKWVLKNTKLQGRRYSLKHHDAQNAWFMGGDQLPPHPRVDIIKPSQIGATETEARMTMGMAASMKGVHVIFAMPTMSMAEKFSNTRIKPIIDDCAALNYGRGSTQTTKVRQIGSSFLHMGGTYDSTGGAISTPAQAVILDEYDFMNMEVAGQYMSRLSHAIEFHIPNSDEYVNGILYRSSTPTLPGYGIDAAIQQGNRMRYMVQCSHCKTRQAPEFFDDVVIPGFDDDLRNFRSEHLDNPRIIISKAYLKCQHCGYDLSNDLLNPDREWVARNSEVLNRRGFETKPFDFYHYNTIPKLLRRLEDVYSYGDWVNFSLGEAYEDANQSFAIAPLEDGTGTQAPYIPPERASTAPHGLFMGVDVGKTCDITIGQVLLDREGLPTDVRLIYWERYNADLNRTKGDEQAEIFNRVQELKKLYRTQGELGDHLPDQTFAMKLSATRTGLQGFYQEKSNMRSTDMIKETEEGKVLAIDRTRMFNHLLSLWQTKRLQVYNHPLQIAEMKTNFRNVKKAVRRLDTTGGQTGEPEEYWVKVNVKLPDHLMHSLVYMTAAGMASGGSRKISGAATVKTAVIGGGAPVKPQISLSGRIDRSDLKGLM